MHRALGRVGPAFPGGGGKQGKELPQHPVLPTPPIPSGWQATQWPAAAFTLAGDGCGEGNFSAEVELLRADCRYTVLWKSLLLKKTTKENRRNLKRYAMPGVYASLALIMNKGKRIEKRQPLTM